VKILFEIGNICRDYIDVYLFLVIWYMYSSDRMKTLIRMLMDCHYIIVYIYLRRKEILLIFLSHFVEHPVKIFSRSTVIWLLLGF